jgi:regulator of protease activity HflC (stomatin/prohibitin superfamily)
VKQIDLPVDMQRSIARQAEAERLRRAKIINAEGEYQAAVRLSEAAAIMEPQAMAIQLRLLQALSQVSTEKNHTVILPIATDVIRALLDRFARREASRPDPVLGSLQAAG